MEILYQDLRYALRMLAKQPGFTITVVLTLTLGIGANTAIFSLIDAVMLEMLPVNNPEELVLLNWSGKRPRGYHRGSGSSFPYAAFEQFRLQEEIFSAVFGFAPLRRVAINLDGHANAADGEMVSGKYFSGLGVLPVLGRPITEADEKGGSSRVTVISYGYWTERLGGDPSVVGKGITLNGVPFTVVGVAPPEFFGIDPGRRPKFWVPLVDQPELRPWGSGVSGHSDRSPFTSVDSWWLEVMGRLRPGITEQEAAAVLNALFQQTITSGLNLSQSEELPRVRLRRAGKGLETLRRQFSKPLLILMAVGGLVLLIACANVAGSLLARAAARTREIAVRLAVGASRAQLIRQLLMESLLLSIIGGACGLLFAYWSVDAVLAIIASGQDPLPLSVRPNTTVLGFTAAASIFTGLLFGLAPAFRVTRVNLTPALKTSTGGVILIEGTHLGFSKMLVGAQVALSLLLLIGALLFARTLSNLSNQNFGFNPNRLLLFRLDPTQVGYDGPSLVNLYGQLLERIRALPGVQSASLSEMTLLGGLYNTVIAIEGESPELGQKVAVGWNVVGPDFFETMQITVLLGRAITWGDTETSAQVAVVNEALARQVFDGGNSIGRRFRNRGDWEIVGVVESTKYGSLREEPPPTVYVPYTQMPSLQGMHFAVRTAGEPGALAATVRPAVQDIDPDLALFDIKTQVRQIDQALIQECLLARLCGFFGALAMLLVSVGLYGLTAYSVTTRTNEIGLRMALGAERGVVLRMIFADGLKLVLVGIALGLGGAWALTRFLEAVLFGVSPTDLVTFVGASLLLAGFTLFASFVPARRAASVDPMVALRYE